MRKIYPLLLSLVLLSGCANQGIQRKDGSSSARGFAVSNLVKNDADILTEITQRELLKSLRLLTEKLYRRNPQEYRKSGHESVEAATAKLFEQPTKWSESPLARLNWDENFKLAFLEGYTGDRVHAFMSALTTMLMAAYNHKTEFFLPDELSAQKFYNSARNIEVAVWKLSSARLGNGGKYLISNSVEGETQNLSFEREFGKLIALQDTLALFIEDRSNRSISRVFQSATTFVFLPI
ncbi:MAG: hypothetical protein KBF24_01940 [Thiobacillaceae bacterium]|jgi:hypothetical protein|nr:hypothetical protein [Thiobacillaceae bacterium]MBP9914952.1 hypothetical protein [Thiobacillaceae bacterium]